MAGVVHRSNLSSLCSYIDQIQSVGAASMLRQIILQNQRQHFLYLCCHVRMIWDLEVSVWQSMESNSNENCGPTKGNYFHVQIFRGKPTKLLSLAGLFGTSTYGERWIQHCHRVKHWILIFRKQFLWQFCGSPKMLPNPHALISAWNVIYFMLNKGSWISDTKFSILPAPMGSKVSTPDSIASAKKTMTG